MPSSNSASAVPGADALITASPGLLLGVLVADCAPILLADPVSGAIGVAHAGWRGTAGDVAGTFYPDDHGVDIGLFGQVVSHDAGGLERVSRA